MKTRYGYYSSTQIDSVKVGLQKSIFFLLLCVDPQTRDEYSDIDVAEVFRNIQYKLNGLNSILYEPPQIVRVMTLLEAALKEYESECFEFKNYRKLILDAGSEVMRLKVGDAYGNHV